MKIFFILIICSLFVAIADMSVLSLPINNDLENNQSYINCPSPDACSALGIMMVESQYFNVDISKIIRYNPKKLKALNIAWNNNLIYLISSGSKVIGSCLYNYKNEFSDGGLQFYEENNSENGEKEFFINKESIDRITSMIDNHYNVFLAFNANGVGHAVTGYCYSKEGENINIKVYDPNILFLKQYEKDDPEITKILDNSCIKFIFNSNLQKYSFCFDFASPGKAKIYTKYYWRYFTEYPNFKDVEAEARKAKEDREKKDPQKIYKQKMQSIWNSKYDNMSFFFLDSKEYLTNFNEERMYKICDNLLKDEENEYTKRYKDNGPDILGRTWTHKETIFLKPKSFFIEYLEPLVKSIL